MAANVERARGTDFSFRVFTVHIIATQKRNYPNKKKKKLAYHFQNSKLNAIKVSWSVIKIILITINTIYEIFYLQFYIGFKSYRDTIKHMGTQCSF